MEALLRMIRLDKYLADMGIGTRQEVKKYMKQGRVSVDGDIVKKPETKVDIDKSKVSFDGREVDYAEYEYYMLNKPAGVISATEDTRCETVIDLIESKKRKDLFPVGRLDKDTEGLLLITNDGALAHRLLSPKKHVDKCYFARVEGKVTEEDVIAFSKGVNIGTAEEEEWTMPGELTIINSDEISEIRLTIQEGKFHQVKRMFQAVGKEVIYLKRERMGTLILDESLGLGEYRELTEEELNNL
jgi:16S rRNA pseudouridine516 synthase